MSERETPSRWTVVAVCVLAVLALSTASVFVRKAQATTPSLVVAAYRLALAALILAPFALTRGRAELRRLTRRDVLLALASGAFLALHFATWITSLELTSVASSVVLVCTSPLFVALLAPIFLKESLTWSVLGGALLAVAGGAVVSISDAGGAAAADSAARSALAGNLLALAGAVTVAGYFMLGRRLRAKLSLLVYVFLTYGTAGVILLAVVPIAGHAYTGYPAETWLWCALLALVPQLIGHTTFNWVLRYVPAANVAVLVLGEPVGTIFLAWLLLAGEAPAALQLTGAALVLAGIYLVARGKR